MMNINEGHDLSHLHKIYSKREKRKVKIQNLEVRKQSSILHFPESKNESIS